MYWYHGDNFFWLFILIIVLGSTVSRIIRSHQREKTIRTAIEKGVPLDPATLHSISASQAASPQDRRAGLLTGSIVTFFVGCGLMGMGYFIGLDKPEAFHPLLGVGGLLWCISLGLFVAHFSIAPRDR
ncbi:MAG TPA: hypothetical protein VNU97_15580 [Rhizomicrobium sp.]|jgi:hypothetical protein|nr:hypothetical protein [Rhizomicrobium sp.]